MSSWALWEITSCSRVFDRSVAVAGRRSYVAVPRRFVCAWPHRWVGLRLLVVAGLVGFVLWVGVADAGAASEVFSDLDGAGPHRSAVESLADEGVFEGTECRSGEFCARDAVERWVMAVWLVRILDENDPPVGASRFVDVDADVWSAPYVARLADLGVTTGCDTEPARFCPHETVTRARMASFLVRAFEMPAASPAGFADVSGGAHAANIDALAASGVTAGLQNRAFGLLPGKRHHPSADGYFLGPGG